MAKKIEIKITFEPRLHEITCAYGDLINSFLDDNGIETGPQKHSKRILEDIKRQDVIDHLRKLYETKGNLIQYQEDSWPIRKRTDIFKFAENHIAYLFPEL